MDKYKINYICNDEKDINYVLISVLNKKLKKYIQTICKNKECEVPSLCAYISPEGGKNC